jgi:hypothetical protein
MKGEQQEDERDQGRMRDIISPLCILVDRGHDRPDSDSRGGGGLCCVRERESGRAEGCVCFDWCVRSSACGFTWVTELRHSKAFRARVAPSEGGLI